MSFLLKIAKIGVLIWLFFCFEAQAQSESTDDSTAIQLAEIEVRGIPYPKYSAGIKIQMIDSLALNNPAHQNISDLLLNQTSLYFKQYGNGMLASAAFRGTGASHTAVMWNGLNINALTYGQSDFSLLPVFANETVSIQYGSAASLYGSDAIGGVINLSSQAQWNQGILFDFQQVIGSFGLWSSNSNFIYSQKKLETKSRFYYTKLTNDFSFKNITSPGQVIENQNNADYKLYGFTQELNYRFAQNRYISARAWYNYRDLAIQPTMSANQDVRNFTRQKDDNLRLMVDYYDNSKLGFFNAKVAYLYDNLLYNQADRSATHRLIGQLRYEKNFSDKLSLQVGLNSQQVFTRVDNYARKYQENRTDIFTFLSYKPLNNWHLSLNVRQAFVTGFTAPLAPSLGSELRIWRRNSHLKTPTLSEGFNGKVLKLKSLFSRSYRVPTLNDRYWNPGGNPTLRSEKGWSGEIGLNYQQSLPNAQFEIELTHFQMLISDWILWSPVGDFWSPQNQREVYSRGFELNQNWAFQIKNVIGKIGLSYAYTLSTNRKDAVSSFENKQLPYSPRHRLAINGNLQYKTWWINLNWHFTGLRYETLDNIEGLLTSIPAFDIFNFSAGKTFKMQKNKIHISLKINNLTNNQYQNYLFRAMPGINYQLGLNYQFNAP
jgi:iron complex outermembrane receptor protein